MVRTGDFAAFISAHPTVLDMVEDEFYDRRTEDPPRCRVQMPSRLFLLARRPPPTGSADPFPQGAQGGPRQPLNGENCTVVLSNVVGFGAAGPTDEDRRVVGEALFSMTHIALQDLPDVW